MKIELNKIPKEFAGLMKKKKISTLQTGILKTIDKKNVYIEAVIKRPERYNPKLMKKSQKNIKD